MFALTLTACSVAVLAICFAWQAVRDLEAHEAEHDALNRRVADLAGKVRVLREARAMPLAAPYGRRAPETWLDEHERRLRLIVDADTRNAAAGLRAVGDDF